MLLIKFIIIWWYRRVYRRHREVSALATILNDSGLRDAAADMEGLDRVLSCKPRKLIKIFTGLDKELAKNAE